MHKPLSKTQIKKLNKQLADGLGIKKIYMTSNTPTPPDNEISMTSRGMERRIECEYSVNIQKDRFRLWRLNLLKVLKCIPTSNTHKVCLVMGNEASGVYKSILKLCGAAVAIPILGKGPSLNVNAAGAIVASHIRFNS